MQNKQITICSCASRTFISKEKVAEIASTLKNKGYNVVVEADLCKKIMHKSPDMQGIAAGVILACYPRAIRSHLDWLGLTARQVIDIRSKNQEEVLSQFGISYSDNQEANTSEKEYTLQKINEFPVENQIDAWYPILDKDRCTECGKCHDFCLFGVYTIENKQIKVVQPQNCKNDCPACARMCPSKAIIFPKYEKSPINGGMEDEELFNPEEMNQLYNERLRMRLQQRRRGIALLKNENK